MLLGLRRRLGPGPGHCGLFRHLGHWLLTAGFKARGILLLGLHLGWERLERVCGLIGEVRRQGWIPERGESALRGWALREQEALW